MAFDPLALEQSGSIHKVQVAQTVRAIPLLLLFHAAAALSIHNVSGLVFQPGILIFWQMAVVGIASGFAAVFFVWRAGRMHRKAHSVLRMLELLCLLLGLVWAMPAAAAIYARDVAGVVPVAGVTLAVLGIATVTLNRVPTGVTVFVALVSTALARALYLANDGHGRVAAIVCGIYGLVLISTTLSSHFDFLRRSRAEIEVHRQSGVIKLLLNDFERVARDWLWETNAEGRLTYVTRRFSEVVQIDEEQLRLRPLRHVLADLCVDDGWRSLDKSMAHEQPIDNALVELQIKGVSASWQVTARPLYDSSGRFAGYRGVCRDVTAAREAQRRTDAAMEASERASVAKSQFLAVVSHELRTPINSIVGFSELLAQERENNLTPETRKEFANTIMENARQLQTLIGDMLDATRIERGVLDLNEQQADAAHIVEIAIKLSDDHVRAAGVSLVAKVVDGVGITGDVTRLKQVVMNLLANAIKFSPPQGVINVEMLRGQGGALVIAIKDAGIGIAPHDMNRVFDPFVQVESGLARRYGGVGLGLPIARRIARLHEGDVTLESTPGAGTTARLVLPPARVVWPKAQSETTRFVA